MTRSIPYPTLVHVARALKAGYGLSPVLRIFLTYLDLESVQEAIGQAPPLLSSLVPKGGFYDAYLAALGEHFTERAGIPPSEWTQEPSQILTVEVEPQPRYPTLHAVLKLETPPAFRRHGLVISSNALDVA